MRKPRLTASLVTAMVLAAAAPGLAAPTDGNLLALDQALDRTAAKLHAAAGAVDEAAAAIADVEADVVQLEADWKAGADPQAILAGLTEASHALGAIQGDLRRAKQATLRTRMRLVDIKKIARRVGSREHWLAARGQIVFANALLETIRDRQIAIRMLHERIVALREKINA
jgi:hypothetical protein